MNYQRGERQLANPVFRSLSNKSWNVEWETEDLTPTWPRVTEDILLLLLLEDDSENSGEITDYFPDLAIIVFILKGHIPMQRISNN